MSGTEIHAFTQPFFEIHAFTQFFSEIHAITIVFLNRPKFRVSLQRTEKSEARYLFPYLDCALEIINRL